MHSLRRKLAIVSTAKNYKTIHRKSYSRDFIDGYERVYLLCTIVVIVIIGEERDVVKTRVNDVRNTGCEDTGGSATLNLYA